MSADEGPTGGLEPRIEVDQDDEQRLRLTATGSGQRIVVVLDDGAAREFADDVLEVVDGPIMHRSSGAPTAHPATLVSDPNRCPHETATGRRCTRPVTHDDDMHLDRCGAGWPLLECVLPAGHEGMHAT